MTAVLTAATLLLSPAATRTSDVQRAMNVLAGTPGVVGAIGALYTGGKRVGQGTAGSRLLGGKGGRIPPGARFRVGSQTKLMTMAIVNQLVKEGKVALDDKLGDVLSGVPVEAADEITVQQLLRHTSGIPDFFETGKFGDFDFTTYYAPIDLVKAAGTLPRTDTGFHYSNTNYVLLGMVIEKVTGHSYRAELQRRIFTPFGMRDTYLPVRPPEGIVGPHGHGYFPDGKGVLRDVDRQNASYGGAAGGVISTADDLSAFYRSVGQQPGMPGELCGGYRAYAGQAPGFLAITFVSPDGNRQFVVSATLSVKDPEPVDAAIRKAAESVLCPSD